MNHHKLIKSLITEIRSLRESNDYYSGQQERMEQRNQQLRNENDRIENQIDHERQEQQSKNWEREDLMNELDKHERWGNEWNASRIRKQLRDL